MALIVLGLLVGTLLLYEGFATGVTGTRLINVSRERHPFWFWLFMCFWGFAVLAGLHGLIFG